MKFINFNNAGSSLTYKLANLKIKEYLDQEEKFGGYYCAELHSLRLFRFYQNLSTLINSDPGEVSFISNTTIGYNLFLNSINIKKNESILIFENEYESNLISILNNKINFKVVKIKENGEIDFDDLKSKIDNRTKVVSVCQIPSNNGNINPVKKIGEVIKKKIKK